jgi:hypothetical protein
MRYQIREEPACLFIENIDGVLEVTLNPRAVSAA